MTWNRGAAWMALIVFFWSPVPGEADDRLPSSTLRVEVQTYPDGSPTQFVFNGDVSGIITDGQQLSWVPSTSGTYTSTESIPPGWMLRSIVCNDPQGSGDVASATATFSDIGEYGDMVTCVFTNHEELFVSDFEDGAFTGWTVP